MKFKSTPKEGGERPEPPSPCTGSAPLQETILLHIIYIPHGPIFRKFPIPYSVITFRGHGTGRPLPSSHSPPSAPLPYVSPTLEVDTIVVAECPVPSTLILYFRTLFIVIIHHVWGPALGHVVSAPDHVTLSKHWPSHENPGEVVMETWRNNIHDIIPFL